MIRFLTDEDFNGIIIEGVRRRLPELDLIRVWDTPVRERPDPQVLEFASSEDRIVLSHDLSTMKLHAHERIVTNQYMPGLFLVNQDLSIGRAIDELVTIAECSRDGEWENRIEYLPL